MNLTAKPDAEIQEFFKYEISRDPPALSNKGSLYSGSKSELIPLLPGMPNPSSDARTKSATAVIFDMAAVIHMLKPKRAATFGQFAPAHLIPFLQAHLTDKTTRLDGVWETYKKVRWEVSRHRLTRNVEPQKEEERASQRILQFPKAKSTRSSLLTTTIRMSFSNSCQQSSSKKSTCLAAMYSLLSESMC